MSATSSRRSVWLGAAFLVIVAACATTGGPGRQRGPADVLTAAEIEPWAAQDLYVVVQRLRPMWLQRRQASNLSGTYPVSIIVDGARQEGAGPEFLKSFRAGDVQEARFLDSKDATTLYGLSMMSGAIVVTTRRGVVRD